MKTWLQYKRRGLLSLFWVLTGIVLTVLGMLGIVDSYSYLHQKIEMQT